MRTVSQDMHGQMKFQWKNRITDAVDPTCDHMIFPGTATFSRANTGRPDDRVGLLQFTGSDRRFFFWFQDKNATEEEDAAIIKKVNDALNGTLPVPEGAAAATPAAAAGAAPSAVQMADLLRVLGMPAPAAPPAASSPAASSPAVAAPAAAAPAAAAPAAAAPATAATPAPAAASGAESTPAPAALAAPAAAPGGALTAADLARAMAGIAAAGGGSAAAGPRPVSLTAVASPENITGSGLLGDAAAAAELIGTLPDGHQTEQELMETIHSPQFQQALSSLSSALTTENYNSIFANFGLDPSAGAAELARGDNVAAFIAAVQAQADALNAARGEGKDQGGSNPNGMSD